MAGGGFRRQASLQVDEAEAGGWGRGGEGRLRERGFGFIKPSRCQKADYGGTLPWAGTHSLGRYLGVEWQVAGGRAVKLGRGGKVGWEVKGEKCRQ